METSDEPAWFSMFMFDTHSFEYILTLTNQDDSILSEGIMSGTVTILLYYYFLIHC